MTSSESIAAAVEDNDTARGNRRRQVELDERMPLGVRLDGDVGEITVELEDQPADNGQWDWILDHHPAVSRETHEVDERYPVEIGSWEMGYTRGSAENREADSKTLYRYKVKVRTRRPGDRLTSDTIADLTKLVRRRRAVTPLETDSGVWLVACLSDLQLGKGDFGGTPATLERVAHSLDQLRAMVRKHKPAGVAIVNLGDLVENIACFYPDQTHTVDLNLTEQIAAAIEVMLAAVDGVIDLVPRVLVGSVPSNHGELRTFKGNAPTDKARDNIDLIIANTLATVFAAAPDRYGHVEVWTPPTDGGDPFVLTLDLAGVMVGFAHGHQVRAMGKGRMAALEQWWQNHQWSDRKRPRGETLPTIADADIVVMGHGHTLLISEQTGRLLIQCPASEGGSESFTTGTGIRSSAGVLTFLVGEQWPLLADSFRIV